MLESTKKAHRAQAIHEHIRRHNQGQHVRDTRADGILAPRLLDRMRLLSIAKVTSSLLIACALACQSPDPLDNQDLDLSRVNDHGVQPRIVRTSPLPDRPRPSISLLSEGYASMRREGFRMLLAQWCLPDVTSRLGDTKNFGRRQQAPEGVEVASSISPAGHYAWRAPCLFLWREQVQPLVGSPFAPTPEDRDDSLALQRAMTEHMVGPPEERRAASKSPLAIGMPHLPIVIRDRTEILFEFDEVRAPSSCQLVLGTHCQRDETHTARVTQAVIEIRGRKLDGDEILLWLSRLMKNEAHANNAADHTNEDPLSPSFAFSKHLALTGLRLILQAHETDDRALDDVARLERDAPLRSEPNNGVMFDLDAIALVDARGDRHWATAAHVCSPQ